MVLQVVLVFSNEIAFGAVEHFLLADVSGFVVIPEFFLGNSNVVALLAFKSFQLNRTEEYFN